MVPFIGAKDNFLIQKKYYGFAFKAFLRSKAALKIPVRKKIFFFKNFHCLWCPNMCLGGIWWYHFRLGPMTKNMKNAIFQIWTFWPKKFETMFSANLLIGISNKFWAFWALEFLKYFKKWLIYRKHCFWSKCPNLKNGIFHVFAHRAKTKVIPSNST